MIAPLRAGQFERIPVAAVNALVAAALVLMALQIRPLRPTPQTPGKTARRAGAPDGRGDELKPGTAPHASRPTSLASEWRRVPVTFCLGTFLGLNLLSLAVSIYPHGTLTALLDLSALFGAYLLIERASGRAIGWILGALLLAGLLAALRALGEYAGEAWGQNNPGWRAFGPFFNPNLLAATAILPAPLTLALVLRAERAAHRAAAGAGVLVFVAALLVSGSRGGALGLLVGGAVFLAIAMAHRLRPDRRRGLALVGLLIALLPVLWVLRVPMLGRLAGIPGTPALAPGSPAVGASERSNAFRRLTWRATAKIVRAKPLLGTGAGTFEFALPRYAVAGYTRMAHESYLQIASEAGLPALLVWLAALGLVVARLVSRRHGRQDWLLPGLAGGLAAATAHNLVDYSWSVQGTALPFWALLGVSMALTRQETPEYHGDTETRKDREKQGGEAAERRRAQADQAGRGGAAGSEGASLRAAVAVDWTVAKRAALATAGVLLLGLNAVWLSAAQHRERGQLFLQARDPRSAVEEFEAGIALTSLDAELAVDLSSAEAAAGGATAAERELLRAAALAPTWGRPHYRLGRLLEQEGRIPEAAAAFERAAVRDPRATQPLLALAQVLEAEGQHRAALAAYRRIIAIEQSPTGKIHPLDEMTDPNPALAHEALGREAAAHGDRQEAIREYQEGAERLTIWRRERGFRMSIRQGQGESTPEREVELLRAAGRVWQRLAELNSQAGQPAAAAEARDEAAAAQAEAQKASEAR